MQGDGLFVCSGKTARQFSFCFHILAETRNDPAKRLIKNVGPVEYSKHSQSIRLALNSFRSDKFVDLSDRLNLN